MEKLKEIDKIISAQFKKLTELTDEFKLEVFQEFQLTDAKNIDFKKELNYPGIYFLEIKNDKSSDNFQDWFKYFDGQWENLKYTPKLSTGRIKKHTELNEWIPLYIGKSRDVGKRIDGHLFLGLEKSTYALKLMAREKLINETFRLKTLKVDVKNYDAIVPRIESQLRNTIYPIIGKQ